MKTRNWLSVPLVAAGLLAAGASGPALGQGAPCPPSTTTAVCQTQIENLGRGFQDQVFKAFQFCKDSYRKTVVKFQTNPSGLPAGLESVSEACGKKLEKVFNPGNFDCVAPLSQAEKTYCKLRDLVTKGKCTWLDLVSLGHLPEKDEQGDPAYGDAWARWILTAMLKAAYEKQTWLVSDFPNIMDALEDPDVATTKQCKDPGPTSSGVNWCAVLSHSPCHKLACRIDQNTTQLSIDLCALPVSSPLSGEVIQEYCQFPWFTGCDTAIVGNPARGIDGVGFAGQVACNTNFRSEGFVAGPANGTIQYTYDDFGGGNPTSFTVNCTSNMQGKPKNIQVCQTNDANSNSCTIAPTRDLCLPPLNPGPCAACGGTFNGPSPIHIKLGGAMVDGDSVSLAHLQIFTAAGAPPDCTSSGAGNNASFVPLFFTTGSFSVDVPDALANCPGCNHDPTGSFSGSAQPLAYNGGLAGFADNYLDTYELGGLATAGGFPAACPTGQPPLAAAFRIECAQTHLAP